MKENKLKIVANGSEDYAKLSKSLSYSESGAWFLHGKLEDVCHIDYGCIYAGLQEDDFKEAVNWDVLIGGIVTEIHDAEHPFIKSVHLNGIYPVEVRGIKDEAVGYFWTAEKEVIVYNGEFHDKWTQYGIVVLKSDTEGLQEAQELYNIKYSDL